MSEAPPSTEPLTSLDDVLRHMAAAALPWVAALAALCFALAVASRLAMYSMRAARPGTLRRRAWELVDHDDDGEPDDDEPWDHEREEALQAAWSELAPYEWPTDRG